MYLSIYPLSNTATLTRQEVWRKHFLCTVPHKILHNYTAYADSIQMLPFTSCKQSAQMGEQPFASEAISHTREKAIHPSVYQISVLRVDILKNIVSHYSLAELETGSTAIISPFVPQGGSTCLGQCTTSNCLLATPHLQCLLTISKISTCHYSGNIQTVHFYKQVFTTLNKCVLL